MVLSHTYRCIKLFGIQEGIRTDSPYMSGINAVFDNFSVFKWGQQWLKYNMNAVKPLFLKQPAVRHKHFLKSINIETVSLVLSNRLFFMCELKSVSSSYPNYSTISTVFATINLNHTKKTMNCTEIICVILWKLASLVAQTKPFIPASQFSCPCNDFHCINKFFSTCLWHENNKPQRQVNHNLWYLQIHVL